MGVHNLGNDSDKGYQDEFEIDHPSDPPMGQEVVCEWIGFSETTHVQQSVRHEDIERIGQNEDCGLSFQRKLLAEDSMPGPPRML